MKINNNEFDSIVITDKENNVMCLISDYEVVSNFSLNISFTESPPEIGIVKGKAKYFNGNK